MTLCLLKGLQKNIAIVSENHELKEVGFPSLHDVKLVHFVRLYSDRFVFKQGTILDVFHLVTRI